MALARRLNNQPVRDTAPFLENIACSGYTKYPGTFGSLSLRPSQPPPPPPPREEVPVGPTQDPREPQPTRRPTGQGGQRGGRASTEPPVWVPREDGGPIPHGFGSNDRPGLGPHPFDDGGATRDPHGVPFHASPARSHRTEASFVESETTHRPGPGMAPMDEEERTLMGDRSQSESCWHPFLPILQQLRIRA